MVDILNQYSKPILINPVTFTNRFNYVYDDCLDAYIQIKFITNNGTDGEALFRLQGGSIVYILSQLPQLFSVFGLNIISIKQHTVDFVRDMCGNWNEDVYDIVRLSEFIKVRQTYINECHPSRLLNLYTLDIIFNDSNGKQCKSTAKLYAQSMHLAETYIISRFNILGFSCESKNVLVQIPVPEFCNNTNFIE